MITSADRECFTEGCCFELALAIHRKAGWPVYAFWNPLSHWTGGYDIHAFVRAPSGLYVDVKGEHTAAQMFDQYAHFMRHSRRDSEIRQVFDPNALECWLTDPEFFNGHWPGYKQRAEEVADFILSGMLTDINGG
jgi:hypothetical protein